MQTTSAPARNLTPTGVVFTLILAGYLLATGVWWGGQWPGAGEPSLTTLRKNERQTFDNLQLIARAQKRYFAKSEALFGEARYAAFITHLWRAVDPSGEPVPLDLIPEELAVAVGTTKATHGYYYVDVRERVKLPQRDFQTIDYQHQWTVAAIPQQAGGTGSLVFMVDQTPAIFARPVNTFSSLYALDPVADGWTELANLEALSGLQE